MSPHRALVALIGVIVPRRLRADWREEWEGELQHRERLLADWDRLDRSAKWDLGRRSLGAFWDALSLQRQRWEDDTVKDVRLAVRVLSKSPGFTGITMLMLALSVGANTAVFSVVNALLLRPLDGVTDPGRLVQVGRQYVHRPTLSDSSYPDYVDYRDQTTTLAGLAVDAPTAFHLSSGEWTERVEAELVSGSYFGVLGVAPARGRLIAPADDASASGFVVVLGHRLWQRRFNADPAIVGRSILLDGRAFTVVGVADEGFTGTKIGDARDVWVPLSAASKIDPQLAARLERRGSSWLEMFGRLKPDVTVDRARVELSMLASRLSAAYPATNGRAGVRVEPGVGRDPDVVPVLRRFASLPVAVVAIVLLIACANVAGLLLARGSARQKEIATRLALGASRARLVRQLLVESAILATMGGAAGLLVGAWLTRWLRTLLPDRYLFLSFGLSFGLDWRVFFFALAMVAVAGALFGVAPALQATRPDLVRALKAARGSGIGPSMLRRRSTLVVLQVALSLTLLVAAGLCVRTLRNASRVDMGYDVGHVLTARLDLGKQRYDEARGRLLQRELIERIEAMPGVAAAGLAVTLPLNDARWENPVRRDGGTTRVQTFENIVSGRYFETMRIPIVAGRPFADTDDAGAPHVAIVNQTLATKLWPRERPVGKRVTFGGETLDVVGVAGDIKGRDVFEASGPLLYLALSQFYEPSIALHVRAAVPADVLASDIQRALRALDADLPIYDVKTMDEHFAATLTPQRLLAFLIGVFGVLALVLTCIGLYGLLAYEVTQRAPEIGVRLALGARGAQILWLFLRRGVRLTATGLGLGMVAAAGLTQAMRTVLFGVSPFDRPTLMAAAGLLLAASVAACLIPAARASHVDPKVMLRQE